MPIQMEQPPFDWRQKALHLAWKLNRAHNLIQDVGAALDEGDDASARHRAEVAQNEVNSVARALNSMRVELPPDAPLAEPDAVASTLAIGGSGVATMALDAMVNTMMALAVTHDGSETDFLIGTYVDAEGAYEVAETVVQAAPRSHGPAVMDLQRAFETEGGIALRERLAKARPRVREIYERARPAA